MDTKNEKGTLLPVYNTIHVRALPGKQTPNHDLNDDNKTSEERLSNLLLKLDILNVIILSPVFWYLYTTGFRSDEFNHWLIVLSLVQLMCPSVYGLAHTFEALRPFGVQVTGCFYLLLIGTYMLIKGSCMELNCGC